MREIGMLLLFLLCALAGELCARRLRLRDMLLEEMCFCLQQLTLRMAMEKQTLSRILVGFSTGLCTPLWVAFLKRMEQGETVQAAWQGAVVKLCKTDRAFITLQQEERRALLDIAAVLCANDPTTQQKNNEALQQRLLSLKKRAEQACCSKGRLYRAMGVFMGAGAVLMVW